MTLLRREAITGVAAVILVVLVVTVGEPARVPGTAAPARTDPTTPSTSAVGPPTTSSGSASSDGGAATPTSELRSTTTSSPAAASPARWRPRGVVSWQWQLEGSVDTGVSADVFDVDLFETSAATVRSLRAAGRRVVCYFSAGTLEPWRPDSASFPNAVVGRPLGDFPDERWLDVRARGVLEPIMEARLDQCARKGFDAAEPDNVDGFSNETGFAISPEDQASYNRWLAAAAHERGLAVALKNDVEQAATLEPHFDFALNEECALYDECHLLRPFLDSGKVVLHVEYELALGEFCPLSAELGLSSMRKRFELDAHREVCPS